MKALVLEKTRSLSLRDIDLPDTLGPRDVRIAIDTVGICGSDVHYYTHGRIGPFVVESPMVLGHEASGTVSEIGAEVTTLKPGDRVCMEPGIPNPDNRATRLGLYNVDPDVTFWATPPIHGCLAPSVVHPEAFTYKLPDTVSFAQGAMIEPLAVGMQAAAKAKIAPGDTALVIGAGPIGILTALAALAGGCARVFISDLEQIKLDIAGQYSGVHPINIASQNLKDRIRTETDGWGLDVIFEASGNPRAYEGIFDMLRPSGAVVLVGMPIAPVPLDIVAAQAREARIETVFRYAHVYDRAIALVASGKIDLDPLVTKTFAFDDAITAFERAAEGRPGDVKLQIKL
ncbi:NAD(P)-dependent alcohol dehydrogenase [Pelagibacterium sp.]|uniref:NAD(P)-dependent alcohol dehydrogenase n=1 Tax=Pelagibacterium sp. TaxID=1967288 RepID=UPI003A92F27A